MVTMDLTDVDGVTDYAARVGAAAICSVGSDLAMPVVAEVCERLGLPSLVSRRTAELCHHKHLVRELLVDAPGAVRHAAASRGDDLTLPLPVIVKPADAQGQRGLSQVTDAADFSRALDHALTHSRTGRAIVEEYVPGPEISVNGYLQDGRLVFIGVSDRVVWPGEFGLVRGHVHPARSATAADLEAAVDVLDHACRAIGLRRGPVYAQMIIGPAGVRLVEVSPRLDGCHLWRLWHAATGVDLLQAALSAACGEPEDAALAGWGRTLVPVHPLGEEPTTSITFDCLPPGTVMPAPDPPRADPAVVARMRYYARGSVVRAVNGRLEKVGYTLRRGADVQAASREREVTIP
nr:ATP-grasp domain-containing protein [Ornithinimicrobium cryptoxanthini]